MARGKGLNGYSFRMQVKARRGTEWAVPKSEKFNLNNLLSRSKLNSKWKLNPEQRDCIVFADYLRIASKTKTLKGVWLHIPNEGKRHIIVALIMKAMGMLPGAPDYVFCWEDGSGFIEFKTDDNELNDWQKVYREWVESSGVNYALVRSPDEGLQALREWGILA